MSIRPAVRHLIFAFFVVATVTGCSRQPENASATAAADAPIPATGSPYDALPDEVRSSIDRPFTGDFDEMVKRLPTCKLEVFPAIGHSMSVESPQLFARIFHDYFRPD